MQSAIQHLVLLGVACAIGWIGRWMSRAPETASRMMSLGQAPNKFTLGYFRVVGRFFMIMAAVGIILYLVLIPLDLMGVKLGR
jgi:hypothetical protein